VTESSGTDPVPLFGPPTPFVIGLDFDPTNFVSFASGGNSDVTDGQLNFGVSSTAGAITDISLFEAGDYTLVGAGTAATQALAGAIMRITVTEIDGAPVAPIALTPVNASVGFNLLANPGIVQPWSLGLTSSISSQLMSQGVPFRIGATRVEVVIDNSLVTMSETSSLAFIAKKDFRITLVPEPSSLLLLLLSLPLAMRRSRHA
jgi:hypothetical protein